LRLSAINFSQSRRFSYDSRKNSIATGCVGSIASTASYSVAAFLLVFFFIRETGVSLREVLLPSSEDLGLAVQLAEPLLKRLRAQRAV